MLVKKPIVIQLEKMQVIQKVAEQNNSIVMESFVYRHHPQVEATKNATRW